ncbi:hypothetical protein T09_8490 [Trichinella sp. T9]|uniref:Secreted protein n=1 Tax=Trichinella murrelli TaxID=144512 RepID=A0A0V0TEC8_9BILA|nr:hypothetical protein T05_7954 [Trichinella murrelli]KRX59672.1 hypothetical protein T09_8490 [Trichinella sp. T9]
MLIWHASISTILSMTVLFHSDNFTLPISKRAQHHSVMYKHRKSEKSLRLLGSIVVSIPACHAGDPGSIPGRGHCYTIKKFN